MQLPGLNWPLDHAQARRVDELAGNLAHRLARRAAVELGLGLMGANDAGLLNGLEVIDVNIAANFAAARRLVTSAISLARGDAQPLTGDELREIDLQLRAAQILLLQTLTGHPDTPETKPAA